ncbi:hypothetical protein STCU_03819 [Strigomonas culicis]|uniref:Uncharacterized protein n=1 Tax=Strigomonas culicis TaxID=28005 RepID=S9UQ16_9TRYP|nr:hypothetical protein STCU_03819 [Strigomonas culicis]|eukprot:EPY30884.1 hypothetical protein STCU_03819 [Strigomonas culicis]
MYYPFSLYFPLLRVSHPLIGHLARLELLLEVLLGRDGHAHAPIHLREAAVEARLLAVVVRDAILRVVRHAAVQTELEALVRRVVQPLGGDHKVELRDAGNLIHSLGHERGWTSVCVCVC